jgi:hypothetical protein
VTWRSAFEFSPGQLRAGALLVLFLLLIALIRFLG